MPWTAPRTRRLAADLRVLIEEGVGAAREALEGEDPHGGPLGRIFSREEARRACEAFSGDALVESEACAWLNRLAAILRAERAGSIPALLTRLMAGSAPEPLDLPPPFDPDDALELARARDGGEALARYLLCAGAVRLSGREAIGPLSAWLAPRRLTDRGSALELLAGAFDAGLEAGGARVLGTLFEHCPGSGREPRFVRSVGELAGATRLFTPGWLADALCESSLGSAWRSSAGRAARLPLELPAEDDVWEPRWPGPERITILDPACGSGSLLLSCYDFLARRYAERGYSPGEAARMILERNLHGVDIDAEAIEVARASLLSRALEDDPRIGSSRVRPALSAFESGRASLPGSLSRSAPGAAGEILSRSYDFVLCNPPYLSYRFFGEELRRLARESFPDSRSDLSAMFLERCLELSGKDGAVAILANQSWMFLPSFEALRRKLLASARITKVIHLGSRAFPSISGDVVRAAIAVCFPLPPGPPTVYASLTDGSSAEKESGLRDGSFRRYLVPQADLLALPGARLAYWLGPGARRAFRDGRPLGSCAELRQGIATGDNARFVRYWHEIEPGGVERGATSVREALASGRGWFPYNKGAESRSWFALPRHVIRFDERACSELAGSGNRLPSRDLYFRPSLTWTLISSSGFSARLLPAGHLFDVNGMSLFCEERDRLLLLAFLCSRVCGHLVAALNPTLASQIGNVRSIPFLRSEVEARRAEIVELARVAVSLRMEEDSEDETSPAFRLPACLVSGERSPARVLEAAGERRRKRAAGLLETERRIDAVFASAYGMQREVGERCDTRRRSVDEARDLVSWAVGVAFGRFPPPGELEPREVLLLDTVDPEAAGEDGALASLEEVLGLAFGRTGAPALIEALGRSVGGGDPVLSLGRYLKHEFHLDHLARYAGRPIYWKLTSGPLGAVECLVYLHSLRPGTLELVRDRFVERARAALRSRSLASREREALAGELESFSTRLSMHDGAWRDPDLSCRERYESLAAILSPLPERARARGAARKIGR